MTITITDKLLTAKNPAKMLGTLLSRLAELEIEMAPLKALEDEYKSIKAAIVAYADDNNEANEDVTISTDDIEVEVSQKDFNRQITDMPALFAFIGKKRFLESCKFPISEIDSLVPKAAQKKFVKRARTGARTFKVTMLAKKKTKGARK